MANEVHEIEGTLFWNNFHKKNDMTGKFGFDLGRLDKDTIKLLQDLGVNVKTDTGPAERGQFVTCNSKFPIKVSFKQGVKQVEAGSIGNESMIKAKVNTFDWNFKGKSGTSLGGQAVQVQTLMEFSRGGDGFDDDADDELGTPPWDDDGSDALNDFSAE